MCEMDRPLQSVCTTASACELTQCCAGALVVWLGHVVLTSRRPYTAERINRRRSPAHDNVIIAPPTPRTHCVDVYTLADAQKTSNI